MTIPTASPPRYVGLGPRLLAQLIDGVLFGVLLLPVLLTSGWQYFDPSVPKGFTEIMYGAVLPLTVIYYTGRYFQTSPGKYLIRARIVDARTFGPPSGAQVLMRILGTAPSALAFGLGFLAIINDARRQGWHDKLAGTVVVRVDRASA